MLLWTPEYIDTALWLDAADNSTTVLDQNGGISQWEDKSGNGRDATQATADARPILTDGAVVFDGVNDFLTCQSFALDTPTSLFVVAKADTLSGDRALLNQQYGDVKNPWQLYFLSTGRLVDWRSGGYASGIVANTAFIFSEVQSGAAIIDFWRDGNAETRGTATTGYAASTAISLGRAQSFGSLGWLDGSISEIVLVLSAVSSDLRQKIEGYLAHKWGLTANLPADHPYKSFAPKTNLYGTVRDRTRATALHQPHADALRLAGDTPAPLGGILL